MWKFLGTPTVQGAISGAIVALVGTILNNYINVKNNNKIIKSNLENLEKTLNHNKENLEKEQKFKEKIEEKKFLREKLEIIAEEIVKDHNKIGEIFGQLAKGVDIEKVKEKCEYKKEIENTFLLSLLYFEELQRLLKHYNYRTIKIYKLMNNKFSKEEDEKLLVEVYEEEYHETSFEFNYPIIKKGRQGVYDKILKQLKIEAKKLTE